MLSLLNFAPRKLFAGILPCVAGANGQADCDGDLKGSPQTTPLPRIRDGQLFRFWLRVQMFRSCNLYTAQLTQTDTDITFSRVARYPAALALRRSGVVRKSVRMFSRARILDVLRLRGAHVMRYTLRPLAGKGRRRSPSMSSTGCLTFWHSRSLTCTATGCPGVLELSISVVERLHRS